MGELAGRGPSPAPPLPQHHGRLRTHTQAGGRVWGQGWGSSIGCLTPARSAKWPKFQDASCLVKRETMGRASDSSMGLREGVSPHSHRGERRPPCQPHAGHLSLERSQTCPGTITGPRAGQPASCHSDTTCSWGLCGAPTWLSGWLTVKYPTQTMTSWSRLSQETWLQWPRSELAMCRNASDRPSAPTMDWQRQGAVRAHGPGRPRALGETPPALCSAAQFRDSCANRGPRGLSRKPSRKGVHGWIPSGQPPYSECNLQPGKGQKAAQTKRPEYTDQDT